MLEFVRRRFRSGSATGVSLTIGLVVVVLAGWAFGAITEDVVGNEVAHIDEPVQTWFVSHRGPWLTDFFSAATYLGSSFVVLPVALFLGGLLWWRRASVRSLLFLLATYGGAQVLFRSVKYLTARDRPPVADLIGPASGFAFPSGHTTLAVAMWGAFAIVLVPTGSSLRRRSLATIVVVIAAVVVGTSRLYLSAHWFTDVLGGAVLGVGWLAVCVLALRPASHAGKPPPDRPGPPARRSSVSGETSGGAPS